MLLSHPSNQIAKLACLAKQEQSEAIVREIALAGARYEPESAFWNALLARLPETPPLKSGVMPHHSRFVSTPGIIGPGRKMGTTTWLRPHKPKGLGYAA
jgi:hypothetical protein